VLNGFSLPDRAFVAILSESLAVEPADLFTAEVLAANDDSRQRPR
jgi:hypothetical protein